MPLHTPNHNFFNVCNGYDFQAIRDMNKQSTAFQPTVQHQQSFAVKKAIINIA